MSCKRSKLERLSPNWEMSQRALHRPLFLLAIHARVKLCCIHSLWSLVCLLLGLSVPDILQGFYRSLSSLPIKSASTFSPAFKEPSAIGRHNSAFAPLKLPMRELLCTPVLLA